MLTLKVSATQHDLPISVQKKLICQININILQKYKCKIYKYIVQYQHKSRHMIINFLVLNLLTTCFVTYSLFNYF
jgi:hypothetical protein